MTPHDYMPECYGNLLTIAVCVYIGYWCWRVLKDGVDVPKGRGR